MGGKPRDSVEDMYRQMRALANSAALGSGGVGPGTSSGKVHRPLAETRRLSAEVSVIALKTPTLPPATTTNCYIVGESELSIIDPATPYPDEQHALDVALAKLAEDGRHPRSIWLTHHHGDHVADAVRLAAKHQIPIAAHRLTADRLPSVPIDRILEADEVVELGSQRWRCVFTPGHAPGHLCFLEERSRACIAGDMIAGVGTILIDPSEGDMSIYLDSLERLARLELSILLPAHGPAIETPEAALRGLIEHRLRRESRVLAALTNSQQDLDALLPTVYSDVPTFLFPLAKRSLLAHLLKLDVEGRASQSDGGWRSISSP